MLVYPISIHERHLRITLKDYISDYYNDISSHHRNIQNALVITGGIRGSSKEKLYQELGFEYLSSRRWLRKIIFSMKLF